VRRRLGLFAALLAIGAAWGLTLPLIRIAVSTGHRPLGLILWQKLIMLALLLALLGIMRKPLPPVRANLQLFAAVAVFGAILPGYFTFLTANPLPAGIRAIIVALVPMFVLPMALACGFERPDARRALGVLLGAGAVVLIGLPGAGVTPVVGLGVLMLALISPLSYGIEATYLAWRGPHGLHPFQLLAGASAVGILLAWPLAAATGQMVYPVPWGRADWAMLAAGVLNALAYSGYVWLIARAGSVFASLIAYIVTGFGIVWSKLLLGESYAPLVWAAFAVMLAAIALVQPLGAPAKSA
jgi:drug/metabolite transporter (DMT)-like permease